MMIDSKQKSFLAINSLKSPNLFNYTIAKYIDELNYPSSINIEELLYSPFSPARIFRLSESVLVEYLKYFQKSTQDSYVFDSTAGIAQLLCNNISKFKLFRRFKGIYSKK
ncbi:DUF4007 family protein [Candidatus Neomarinimicrobiota bacterium]